MGLMPSQILGVWIRGLVAVGLIALGVYLAYEWYDQSRTWSAPVPTNLRADSDRTAEPAGERRFRFEPGWNRQTALLAGAATTLLVCACGGPLLLQLLLRRGGDAPPRLRNGEAVRVGRPDGVELQIERYGPPGGQPVVLTHGLGGDSTQWAYAKRELGQRYRLTVWDLPGAGLSTRPRDNDYRMDRLADHLLAVVRNAVEDAKGRPVVLLGHSLGGMINLEFARRFHAELGRTVAGFVQAQTTYTNPLRTAKRPRLYTALQKPVIEPLLHLTVWLSPLVRLLNALSYLNGSAHLSVKRSGFAGRETYGQLDFAARFYLRTPPGPMARTCLGMLRWDAEDALRTVSVPTLVVAGDRDPTCRPEASARMRAGMPRAELSTLTPAKHLGVIERHEAFGATVNAFVEGLDHNAAGPVDPHTRSPRLMSR